VLTPRYHYAPSVISANPPAHRTRADRIQHHIITKRLVAYGIAYGSLDTRTRVTYRGFRIVRWGVRGLHKNTPYTSPGFPSEEVYGALAYPPQWGELEAPW